MNHPRSRVQKGGKNPREYLAGSHSVLEALAAGRRCLHGLCVSDRMDEARRHEAAARATAAGAARDDRER